MTTMMHGGDVAIVGAAETDRARQPAGPSRCSNLHAGRRAQRARRRRPDDQADVDGVATAGPPARWRSRTHLGITPRWLDGTMRRRLHVFMLHVRHAAAAIAAGLCDVVLVTHGESGRSRVGMAGRGRRTRRRPRASSRPPYGAVGPPTDVHRAGAALHARARPRPREQLAAGRRRPARVGGRATRGRHAATRSRVEDVLASRGRLAVHLLDVLPRHRRRWRAGAHQRRAGRGLPGRQAARSTCWARASPPRRRWCRRWPTSPRSQAFRLASAEAAFADGAASRTPTSTT